MKYSSNFHFFSLMLILPSILLIAMNNHLSAQENDNRIKRFERIELLLQNVPTCEEDVDADLRYKLLIQNQNLSSRKFPIYPYKKALDFCDKLAIDDAYENCPTTLKDELDKIATNAKRKSQNPEICKELINRIILYGPSGSGKTTLAYATAYHCKLPFSFVKAPELADRFKDSSPIIINDLIGSFVRSKQPSLIIIDEATAFIKKIKNQNDGDTGAVEELWMTLDEAQSLNPNLIVILTANKLKYFPKTFFTRFGGCRTKIDLPTAARRLTIINKIFNKFGSTDKDLIEKTADYTSVLSLREVSMALYRARGNARIRCENQNIPLKITAVDIQKALRPFLEEHNQDVWEKRKKVLINGLKNSAPYILQAALFAGGSFLAWRLSKLQAEQAQKNHDESINLQLMQQVNNETVSEYYHQESMTQANNHHKQSLGLQIELHNDAHSWTNILKQAAGTVIGITGGALIVGLGTVVAPHVAALGISTAGITAGSVASAATIGALATGTNLTSAVEGLDDASRGVAITKNLMQLSSVSVSRVPVQ